LIQFGRVFVGSLSIKFMPSQVCFMNLIRTQGIIVASI
jgi:hypothetical protein